MAIQFSQVCPLQVLLQFSVLRSRCILARKPAYKITDLKSAFVGSLAQPFDRFLQTLALGALLFKQFSLELGLRGGK